MRNGTKSDLVDLSRNELPRPLHSALVRKALNSAAAEAHRYPVTLLNIVEAKIERRFAGAGRSAVLTRGVDDAVDALLRAKSSLRPFVFLPTFDGFLERFRALPAEYDSTPLGLCYKVSRTALSRVAATHFVFAANPNNPTGTLWDANEVRRVARRAGCVFLDETYIDFARQKSFEAVADDRTFVFRSFSKAYGLAGARLGVLTGPSSEVDSLRRTRIFCPIDVFSLHVLNQALDVICDNSHKEVSRIQRLKEKVSNRLRAIGYEILPTHTNFLLLCVGERTEAVPFLRERGILVKNLVNDGMVGWLRITIGSSRQMDRCVAALSAFRQRAPQRKSAVSIVSSNS